MKNGFKSALRNKIQAIRIGNAVAGAMVGGFPRGPAGAVIGAIVAVSIDRELRKSIGSVPSTQHSRKSAEASEAPLSPGVRGDRLGHLRR